MFVRIRRAYCGYFLGGSALALLSLGGTAVAQTKLPEVVVRGTKPKPVKPRAVAHRPAPTTTPATPAEELAAKSNAFDTARSNLYTTIGTSADVITHATIDALPGGDNQTVEKILLQAPGCRRIPPPAASFMCATITPTCSIASMASCCPTALTGFSSILDASWIGSIALVLGALPAEYGLRTVGLVDITTRPDIFNNSGQVSVYGGSQGTIHADDPIRRHVRQHLPDDSGAGSGNPRVAQCGLLPRRPILLRRALPANPGRHREFNLCLQPDP